MFNQIVTTAQEYKEDELSGSLIDVNKQKGTIKEYQRIIAIGDSVRGMKVGDLVMINPIRYGVKKHQAGSLKDGIVKDNPVIKYNIPQIELDHVNYLLLFDSDISFVITDYEVEDDKKEQKPTQGQGKLILPESKLIV